MINDKHIKEVILTKKVAIILINLGSIDDLSLKAIRKYYRKFLSDKRVITMPSFFWLPILYMFILPFRPSRIIGFYKAIWHKKQNMSPLIYYTKMLKEKLQEKLLYELNWQKLSELNWQKAIKVEYAMRYGNKDLKKIINKLHQQNFRKMVFIPLYPQYSSSTVASVHDEIADIMKKFLWQPQYNIIPPYYDNDMYIAAITDSINNTIKRNNIIKDKKQALMLCFHGLPQSQIAKGEPYLQFCHKSANLIREKLGWERDQFFVTFQSRFGPKKWIKPYTNEVLSELPQKNITKLLLISPGFATDSLETLHELNIMGRKIFLDAGGIDFQYIDCLNDKPQHIEMIYSMIKHLV